LRSFDGHPCGDGADLLTGRDEFAMNFITAYREQFPDED
jgi:hypothetical protein